MQKQNTKTKYKNKIQNAKTKRKISKNARNIQELRKKRLKK